MPNWSDIYYLEKPKHGQPVPPLKKGMFVTVHWVRKKSKYIYDGGIQNWVRIEDVIGDEIVARTLKKSDHIRKNELMIFDKSYIISIDGGWDFAMEFQSVKVSRRIYHGGHKITFISGSFMTSPLSYSLGVLCDEDLKDGFDDEDLLTVSLPDMLRFAPELEPEFRKGITQRLICDLFLPIDTAEREDDQDEWQYYD